MFHFPWRKFISASWTGINWTQFNWSNWDGNSTAQLEFIIPSWTGFNWSVPFSVTEIYFGQLNLDQLNSVHLVELGWELNCSTGNTLDMDQLPVEVVIMGLMELIVCIPVQLVIRMVPVQLGYQLEFLTRCFLQLDNFVSTLYRA